MRDPLALVLFLICSLVFTEQGYAQASKRFHDPLATYGEAADMFEADAFGPAGTRYHTYIELPEQVGTARAAEAHQRAELNRALAAQRAELPEAAVLLERFIDRYSPQPIAVEAIKIVADNAFADRDYERAETYYARMPLSGLAKDQRDEVRFRLGYTAFASKDFGKAARYLGDLRAREGLYQEPATYYFALTRFYSGDNAGAKVAFESLKDSERYAKVLPSNLAQIYFAEAEYERVIEYTVPLVDQPGVRQRKQLYLLIGRSFFELDRHEEALPYLEAYAENARRMSAADFYQLGYAQYQSGAFAPAAANLKQLAGEDSPLAQQALYYLGNAHLQLDERREARPAFAAVSRMDYDPKLTAEAAWNVAKLNYELGYDQEALAALQSIAPGTAHYAEAQTLLSAVVLKSRDYARALTVFDGLPELSPGLRETRQQVRVLRGLQLLQERQYDDAEALLGKSLEDAADGYYKALATYWLGDLAYRRGELTEATQRLNRFLSAAEATATAMPDDANVGTANYLLGYVYLKEERYGVALGHFQEAVAALQRRERLTGANATLARMLGDAVVRAGDANFKRNDYAGALRFYDEAIVEEYAGYVYALYQKAIIEGLRGDDTEKIIALETIADDYPRSAFADEALYELGVTYQSINQLKRANQTLERLLTEKPSSPLRNEALLRLGLVSINQGNTETAINYYKQVFANKPKAHEVRRAQDALQEIYIDELGRPDDYFAFLETVPGFELDASVRDSINFAAAKGQYQTARYDRAIEQFSRYLKEFPRGGYALEALYRRADSYLVLEQFPEALKDYESLIQRGESNYYEEALDKAARLAYDAEGDFDKAYRYYARLLETEGERANAAETSLMALRSAYRSGNLDAVYSLADRVAASLNLSEADQAIAAFYRGKVAYDRKDYDRALASFNTIIKSAKDSEAAAEARYLVARIYFLRREVDLAETITIQAQRASSAYPYWVARSTLLLIDIFLEQEDYLSARAVAEGLVANYRGDADLEREAKEKLLEVERTTLTNSLIVPEDTSSIQLDTLSN